MLYSTYIRPTDPFALMRSMLQDVDRAFAPSTAQPSFPLVNVWQGEEAVAITAELPGVEAADITITVKDNILSLSGERRAPQLPDGARWHRNERGFGKFSRAVRLPFAASDERVEARLQNGVLRVIVGRPKTDKARRIEIKAA